MARLRFVVAIALGLVLAGSALARPKSAGSAAQAKLLYDEAMRHYNVGEFPDAAAKFIEAYKAKRDANFLYNAAQAYRLAGNTERALFFYRSFLRDAPDAANRVEVEDRIKKLEEPAPPKPEPAPEPKPEPRLDTRVPASAVPPEPVHSDGGRPVYKKWWFWSAIGVIAVGGVALAVVLSSSKSGPAATELGDVGPGRASALRVSF